MSVQAMAWALKQRIVTKQAHRHVLLCLCNYAGEDGRAAWPSQARLAADTGLTERGVRLALVALEEQGVIVRGNQAIAAAHIQRADRRPVVYDIDIERGEPRSGRAENDRNHVPVVGVNGGNGMHERGEPRSGKPSINHQEDQKQKHVQPSAARFDDWWAAYPNKKGKQSAEATWRKLKLDDRCDDLIAHAEQMQQHDDAWRRGYIPMGSTYLNQARWDDEPMRAPTAVPAVQQPSKTLTAIQRLEGMKNGLAGTRAADGVSETPLLGFGADAGY